VDAKKDFGVKVYDLMNSDDMQGAQSCFGESRRVVTGFEEEIANKRAAIEALEAEARAGGGGGEAAPAVGAPTPSVAARAAAQASVRANSPVPSKEESKKDEDGFQTVPVRSTKEPWRPRRGRA